MATFIIRSSYKSTYPYPWSDNISKIFTEEFDETFIFDQTSGLWVCDEYWFYMNEEWFKEYIDKWLTNNEAMDFYQEECNKLYFENKKEFDKLKKS